MNALLSEGQPLEGRPALEGGKVANFVAETVGWRVFCCCCNRVNNNNRVRNVRRRVLKVV